MLPEIRYRDGIPCLTVDGAPYPILGGELHNSSFSSLTYMREQVWPYLRGLNLNTVVLPMSWEAVEPEEGTFDFSLLAGILKQARQENKKLVLLWFGLWKNGESFYVPQWVKKDRKRFFRAVYPDGTESSTVSPFCEEGIDADKRAFARLMAFLREEDGENTVILVQVENEIGFLGADRDRCEPASRLFIQRVPEKVAGFFGKNGTWTEAFGGDAGEYFMAARYASVIERIAAAGKAEKKLPMCVNAWLEQHPDRAGVYPSGGPVAKMIPLWRTLAPSLDMVCPDIYLREFGKVCRDYSLEGNPLFIPETGRNAKAASRVFYAFGIHALGFSPFGIEELPKAMEQKIDAAQMAELNIMAEAFDATHTVKYLPESYRLIDGLYPRLNRETVGFIQENPYDSGTILEFPNFDLQLDYLPGETGSGGLILPEENGFYIAGCCTRFTVLSKKGSDKKAEILRFEEGKFENGVWRRGRVLNGDELWDLSLGVSPMVKYIQFQMI